MNSRFFEKMIKAVINEILEDIWLWPFLERDLREPVKYYLVDFFSVKGGFYRRRSKFSNFHNWKYFLTLITMVTSTKGISLPPQWQPNIDDSSGLSRRYFKRIQIFREIISGIKWGTRRHLTWVIFRKGPRWVSTFSSFDIQYFLLPSFITKCYKELSDIQYSILRGK